MEKQIAIIGAGVSGLLACKYTLAKGFNPIVFEAQSGIGGVWIKTLETTKLQTPKSLYQVTDFPWPDSVTELFPNSKQVLDYIQGYANHFDLLKHIRFNRRVVGISYDGPSDGDMQAWSLWGGNGEPFSSLGKWSIHVHNTLSSSTEVYQVDFVVICVGRFSDVPNVPEFEAGKGPETFGGEVVHSMDYSNMDNDTARKFLKGKRVTVVGLQKSALDIAMECADLNGVEVPCRVLYKTEHWNLPDYFPWGVPLALLYFSRFSELLVHKPGQGLLLFLLATLLSPLRWASSKFVESHIKRKHQLAKYGMVPKHSFLQEISSCLISTVPDKFYDKVEDGSIILEKAPSFSFCKDGIIINNNVGVVKSDVVIFGTGFKGEEKLRDIFESKSFQDSIMGSPHSAVPLYRECIHPRIPQMAVIGFSESIANLYTSEIRCRWLAELLDGTFRLPTINEMEMDVCNWDRFMKRYSGGYYRRSCIGALHIWYNDQLCKDMGWNPKRKKGFFAELFQPYGPMDYVSP